MLYFSFGTSVGVNIKQVCSSSMYKRNFEIWSRLGELVRCILGFNFFAQELYI